MVVAPTVIKLEMLYMAGASNSHSLDLTDGVRCHSPQITRVITRRSNKDMSCVRQQLYGVKLRLDESDSDIPQTSPRSPIRVVAEFKLRHVQEDVVVSSEKGIGVEHPVCSSRLDAVNFTYGT